MYNYAVVGVCSILDREYDISKNTHTALSAKIITIYGRVDSNTRRYSHKFEFSVLVASSGRFGFSKVGGS